jgi:hypothetical protein
MGLWLGGDEMLGLGFTVYGLRFTVWGGNEMLGLGFRV